MCTTEVLPSGPEAIPSTLHVVQQNRVSKDPGRRQPGDREPDSKAATKVSKNLPSIVRGELQSYITYRLARITIRVSVIPAPSSEPAREFDRSKSKRGHPAPDCDPLLLRPTSSNCGLPLRSGSLHQIVLRRASGYCSDVCVATSYSLGPDVNSLRTSCRTSGYVQPSRVDGPAQCQSMRTLSCLPVCVPARGTVPYWLGEVRPCCHGAPLPSSEPRRQSKPTVRPAPDDDLPQARRD
ncbi:hypothetical protein C8Q70DRAFT_385624 [Cubamyces menziesii]|nr:hypothetical protein C8Q70DRAFT_385624 [Cubamyces menziesii]